MKTILIALLTGMLVSAAGCEEKETILPPDADRLEGEWQLAEPTSTYVVTLRFTDKKRFVDALKTPVTYQLAGRASVNQYFATASIGAGARYDTESQFSVSTIGATKMAGPPEAMAFETDYFQKLGKVERYELTNRNQLKLYYGGENPGLLVYEKIK